MIQGALLTTPVVSREGIFFWLLRTTVKVRYSFFVTAALLGMNARSKLALAVWIAVSFAAILLHELGHAMAARAFGGTPEIELYSFGGVTRSAWVETTRWHQRVVISLAGSGSGFPFGGLEYAREIFAADRGSYLIALAGRDFLWITLGWGLFNLLPLLPMDGGLALAEVLEHLLGGGRGQPLARRISVVTGAAGVAAGLVLGQTWAALLCGMFAIDNYQRLRGLAGVELPR